MSTRQYFQAWCRALDGGRAALDAIETRGSTPAREAALAGWMRALLAAESALADCPEPGADAARTKLAVALHHAHADAGEAPLGPAWALVASALDSLSDRRPARAPAATQEIA